LKEERSDRGGTGLGLPHPAGVLEPEDREGEQGERGDDRDPGRGERRQASKSRTTFGVSGTDWHASTKPSSISSSSSA
jgi:hypothetical protein